MSDTFDPDAWPHSPSGASRPEGVNPPHDDDDDDYDSFDLSQTSAGYGDEDDDDDYDSAAFGAPSGPRAPAPAPGASAYGDDEEDDDDYDSGSYGTSYAAPAMPGNDYENDYNYDEPARAPRGQSQADDDDYDNSYGNYDTYDDEDPYNAYNDYDDEGSGGGARKLILGGLAVLIVLIILGVGYSLLSGGKKANNNVAQGGTPTTKATTATSTGTEAVPPADAVTGLDTALTAWGKFAIDGNLNDVKPYFVNGTDQYNQFVAEAPQIQARNVGGAPLTMTMTNATTVKDNDNEWDFKGTVAVTRTGEQSQSFPWDIQIARQPGQPWQVLSVRQYQA